MGDKARAFIEDNGFDSVMVLDEAAYDEALVGVTTDCRAVYDYHRLVQAVMDRDGCTEGQATEWVDYNVLGSVPQFESEYPIILDTIREDED